ncbi:unnamed protein product [Toxocara canis]|uniref:Chromo domain-containing protein n=1 Tax=Toxocara canis TaxID=6265 RepID=A0A183VAB3_TOXCA|nr:unnamed protein product [Toxocara canis]
MLDKLLDERNGESGCGAPDGGEEVHKSAPLEQRDRADCLDSMLLDAMDNSVSLPTDGEVHEHAGLVNEEAKQEDGGEPETDENDESRNESDDDGGDVYVVEKILKKRTHPRTGAVEYLIKWKDYDREEDNTWEPAENCVSAPEAIKDFEERLMKKKKMMEEGASKSNKRLMQRSVEARNSRKKVRLSSRRNESSDEIEQEKGPDEESRATRSKLKCRGDSSDGGRVDSDRRKKVERIVALKRHADGALQALVRYMDGKYGLEWTNALQKSCAQKLFDYYESLVVFAGNANRTIATG